VNDFWTWLLDLDRLSLADEGVRLGFARPLPGWAWALVIAGCVALALWSYRRLAGSRPLRMTLAGARALVLLAVAVLIAGPQLARTTESVERDWVLVLVDRSASLTIADAEPGAGAQGRTTREAQVRAAIQRAWPEWTELARERQIVWLGFDAGAFELDTGQAGGSTTIDLGEPDGQRTALGAAIDQALARAAARPLSAVVLVTDGRSADDVSRPALRRLRAERVPVHAVALGSEEPLGDLSVASVDAPRAAFVGDVTPIRVELDQLGSAQQTGQIRLIDTRTGEVLDEQRVDEETGPGLTLSHRATETEAGDARWAVEIVPDGPDLLAGNNRIEIDLELVDRPLRVLYIDGYPRWEQRYLRNLLLREASITSSALMLAADRRYIQEGNVEIDTLPASPEEWAEYDVVILGDVRPDLLRIEQLSQLRDHVAQRGGGLLWIGGEAQTPERWWESELADLIPFARGATETMRLPDPFVITPSPDALRLGVMRLTDDPDNPWPDLLTDPETGWSTLYYGQLIEQRSVKPTAEILARAQSTFTDDAWPLVLSMRYGAGRSIYVATDELWRYRYARGELLYDRFWVPLIRLLGREALARSGRPAVLEASPRDAVVEQPVRIRLELLDQALVDDAPPSTMVRLEREARPGEAIDEDELPELELTLRPDPDDPRVYSTSWLASEAGTWTASPADAFLAGLDLRATIDVALPQDELRVPETDHDRLEALAAETGGLVVTPANIEGLSDRFPNRQVRIRTERAEALWDTPLALITLLVLLTAEWVGRRVIRLI
jgi:hypothetical protein